MLGGRPLDGSDAVASIKHGHKRVILSFPFSSLCFGDL